MKNSRDNLICILFRDGNFRGDDVFCWKVENMKRCGSMRDRESERNPCEPNCSPKPFADACSGSEKRLVQKERRIADLEKKLEKMDATLEVLLEKLNRKERETEKRITGDLKKNVIPFIEKIKRQFIDARTSAYLTIIEENLSRIACGTTGSRPFSPYDFTVNEIQILELIKQGMQSKEIAALLHLSMSTIAYYRNNIRRKLGIRNKKENLFSYLNALEHGSDT